MAFSDLVDTDDINFKGKVKSLVMLIFSSYKTDRHGMIVPIG